MKEKNFIYDVTNIRDLAPSILKKSKKYRTILTVIDALISKHIIANIKYLEFLERIDTMQEWELDLLAKELSVDFYDFTMTISEKRESCKQSFSIHAIKGTNKAVQNALNIFYKKATIKEFTEFSGVPGTFKIEIQGIAGENFKQLINRVEVVKKKSQHFVGISFKNTSKNKMYVGTHLRYGTKVKLFPQEVNFYLNNINLEHKNGDYIFRKEGMKGEING